MQKNSLFDFIYNHLNEFKALLYSTFIYLNLDLDIVKVLIWLMLIDTLSGILKAFILVKRFDFKVLFFGICSKLLVLLIPMVVALVGKGISKSYDFVIVLDCILKILVVSEGLSIITNFYVIKTKKEVKNLDIITLLLSAIRNLLLRIIKSTIKEID
jgi:toxin secretion/phage lysis holin